MSEAKYEPLAEPKEIWLAPWCQTCEHYWVKRAWNEDNVWGRCGVCGAKPVKYVLAEPPAKAISGDLGAIPGPGAVALAGHPGKGPWRPAQPEMPPPGGREEEGI